MDEEKPRDCRRGVVSRHLNYGGITERLGGPGRSFVARVFRRGAGSKCARKTLASKEASYKTLRRIGKCGRPSIREFFPARFRTYK